MIATYILIICFSAGFASWAAVRLWQRVMPMLSNRYDQGGGCAVLPAVAFLIVVGAPGSVLFFALLSLALGLFAPAMLHALPWRTGMIAIAVTMALAFMPVPNGALLGTLPMPAIYGGSFALWAAISISSVTFSKSLSGFASVVIFSCLPLGVAPFLLHHASSVVTDAAILSSAWLGVMLLAKPNQMTGAAAQLATALLLGYLQITAIWQGAWIAGLASMALWVVMIVVGSLSTSQADEERLNRILPHA